jgi:uncharacterized protein YcbK (DUF882 family)
VTTRPQTQRLTAHFLLAEFDDRHAERPPPPESIQALERLCRVVLEPIRRRFGPVTISSGFRTQRTNAAVGGADLSRHLYHAFPTSPAADFRARRGSVADWAREAEKHMAAGGLGVYDGHLHADLRPIRSRW